MSGDGLGESGSGGPGPLPHHLEEILQQAFSHMSSDSFITEFVRRTMDGQSRGNPPASKFAIENCERLFSLEKAARIPLAAVAPPPSIFCGWSPTDASRSSACAAVSRDGGQATDACAICQDDIIAGCKMLQMPCKHCFHTDCLHRWLAEHNTCPVCRCEVESNCPRYNEANYDGLKGKLDKVTGEEPCHRARSTRLGGQCDIFQPPAKIHLPLPAFFFRVRLTHLNKPQHLLLTVALLQ